MAPAPSQQTPTEMGERGDGENKCDGGRVAKVGGGVRYEAGRRRSGSMALENMDPGGGFAPPRPSAASSAQNRGKANPAKQKILFIYYSAASWRGGGRDMLCLWYIQRARNVGLVC